MSINVTARSIGESQTPGMKLSAVIPCRNAADRLPRQLEALTREKWQGGWEVVIADNGSTDGTREVAEGFRDRLPHLLVVDASARRGASYARNVGARLASGDAFLFLDADDEIAPGYLPAMADALGHHDFVAAHRDSESLNPKWIRSSRHTHPYEGFRNFYDFLPHAGGTRIGVRRPTEGLAAADAALPLRSDHVGLGALGEKARSVRGTAGGESALPGHLPVSLSACHARPTRC